MTKLWHETRLIPMHKVYGTFEVSAQDWLCLVKFRHKPNLVRWLYIAGTINPCVSELTPCAPGWGSKGWDKTLISDKLWMRPRLTPRVSQTDTFIFSCFWSSNGTQKSPGTDNLGIQVFLTSLNWKKKGNKRAATTFLKSLASVTTKIKLFNTKYLLLDRSIKKAD